MQTFKEVIIDGCPLLFDLQQVLYVVSERLTGYDPARFCFVIYWRDLEMAPTQVGKENGFTIQELRSLFDIFNDKKPQV